MQIVTLNDFDFPELHSAFMDGNRIGQYWRDGQQLVVCATTKFVMISSQENPEKIAIRPVRNLREAEIAAVQFLSRQEEKGSRVELFAEYRGKLEN